MYLWPAQKAIKDEIKAVRLNNIILRIILLISLDEGLDGDANINRPPKTMITAFIVKTIANLKSSCEDIHPFIADLLILVIAIRISIINTIGLNLCLTGPFNLIFLMA